ncbi:MAG: glycosyltransferase family 4 protein [candidate division WOR-3 bacterium]|nr:glycosyltransferase family 4 protein [candidate division WOR-3 bacterium]MDW8113648.1 glycosyltransferase family 4 protein [candidate division WOR-3 bacterium]
MKILFITFPGFHLFEGGIKTQVISLKEELRKLGLEVKIFCENFLGKEDFKNYDIIHFFGSGIKTYHLFQIIVNFNKKIILTPVFYSQHSLIVNKIAIGLFKFFYKYFGFYNEHLILKEMVKRVNLIICNTFAEKKLIKGMFNLEEEKLEVLPNGVSIDFYFASPQLCYEKLGLKDFILYVGHIGYERKNLLRCLEVLKKIDVPTLLVGKIIKNKYSDKCLSLIKKTKNIHLIDELPNGSELLKSIYAACDVFLLPSYYETPGLSALEAGLAGAKILITKYGGTKEYFKDYAFYLNPYSKKDIEKKLFLVLRKKKDTLLREHIKNNYTWDKIAEKLIKIYEKFLKING